MPDAPRSAEPFRTGDATLMDGYVPVVDLGLDAPPDPLRRASVARAVGKACESSGFLVVVGHSVSAGTVSALYRSSRTFFGQERERKARVERDPTDPLQRGYGGYSRLEMYSATRFGERALDRDGAPPDPALLFPNRWPAIPGFRESYLAYHTEVERLALDIMRLFALALALPEDWFDDKFARHMTPLMVNYYPAQTATPPGTFRNEPHTDFGAVTVLYQDEAPGGLQVRDPSGGWLDVPPIEGSFVVNLGELMTRWTNDRWASTVHRVVNPPRDQSHRDRISIAFFYQPDPQAVITAIPSCVGPDDPPRHPEITSGEYFLAKSRRAYVERVMGRRHT
ncbi:isopenicillin N synthase family dioxygenase [Sphaerisporangium rhizosphaerae]|uniref:Isopenicillin N synthase family dioxygenase n=1 Tax=Sphaerisporangium rhizosphaerae TaxID=2269375 RepID=A0ABW2PCI3_9ACTN